MKLFVDVGNSRVKWAFGFAGRFVADGEAPRDSGASLTPLLDCPEVPEEIRIANVAGAETGLRIAAILQEHFQVRPVFAGSAAAGAGVRSGYSNPGQLGVDRWLALCAAFSRYQAPVCVVDAGTATTLDLVSASGQHEGGLILPGIELMQRALMGGTGDLARLAGGAEASADPGLPAAGLAGNPADCGVVMGRDTAAAIRYGALQATAGFTRDCMDELCARTAGSEQPGVLLVTGGAAPALQAALLRAGGFQGPGAPHGHRLEYRPLLVLEGLALDPPCFTVAG
ncbi:MAG: type III pantothenate kinase [Gammaproteobacteria bacterium]|nr:type III pantothenate kinase [Gammaproteobacteria bacterium]